jgi:ubiquinone/menaquinone biosynthesis C-methylase UbiE
MNADEYGNLERVEAHHWYYSGKREIARRWLERARPITASDRLLDCGAGTGCFALEMSARCDVTVLDDHEAALKLLRAKFPAERVISLAGDKVPLPDGVLEYVTALDVLEHVPDDAAVVRGFHRLLRPGGVALVTVPASMALWSDWDVVLHHYRRYSRPQLEALFPSAQWELVYSNYTNVFAFPAVWFLRRWRGWFPSKTEEGGGTGERAEDKVPAPWLNRLLRALFVLPAFWRLRFPFGVSLVLVARRRAG